MFRSTLSLAALLSLVPLLVNAATFNTAPAKNAVVPGQFILELETPDSNGIEKRAVAANVDKLLSSVLTHLAAPVTATIHDLTGSSSASVKLPGFKTRRTFKSQPHVFAGAVVAAADLATDAKGEVASWEDVVKGLETVQGVKRAWPVRVVDRPSPVYATDSTAFDPNHKSDNHLAFNPVVKNSPADYQNDKFPPHQMTGVDKLHEKGVLGDGVKIGVIDTGVDYKNPILGGCFGPGCHVSFGNSFVDDSGTALATPSNDPYTDCSEHGTHVSGTIGALANSYGFSGVAPHADLGMYRVFGCEGSAADDIIVDALLQSITDKCDIVSLSLGGSAGWLDQSPSQTIVEKMNRMGIFTTISAGNDRSEGLFFANGPAATRTGISVASVDVDRLPAYYARIIGKPDFPYLSALPLNTTGVANQDLRVYFTSTDPTIKNDGCNPLPDSTPDLSGRITVVQRGTCTFDTKMKNVAAKGGKVVLIYNSATASSAMPYLTTDNTGILAVGSLRREEGLLLLDYYKQNPRSLRISFSSNDAPTSVVDTVTGGIMSYYSEFGPTFDMFAQPSFAAPGGNILSTFPLSMSGLGVISGTSMAAPFVAGSVGLLLSQERAKGLTPVDARGIFASTAEQIPTTRGGDVLSTVVLQGGGLVQVDKALATGTLVSPYELQLNDTMYLNGTQQVTIKNTNSFPVTYTFSSTGAVALGNYDTSYRTDIIPSTSPSSVAGATARVTFSTAVVVVEGGSSATVSVTVTPPRLSRSSMERFPIYSGYVEISGSAPAWGDANEELVVPFFGLSARMVDMPIIDTTATVYGEVKYPFIADGGGNALEAASTVSANRPLTVYTRLAGGTRRLTIDLVDANTTFVATIPTDRSVGSTTRMRLARRGSTLAAVPDLSTADLTDTTGITSFIAHGNVQAAVAPSTKGALYSDVPIIGNIATYGLSPRDFLISNSPNPASDTQTTIAANGYDFVQSGATYRVLVRALKITADPTLESSYESWLSYPITFQ
ncbi:hypothetical protein JCM10212_000678 [Sporobolomyces blumeae]